MAKETPSGTSSANSAATSTTGPTKRRPSWVRIVGDVWLVGTHPRWPASASADPLVVEVEAARYAGRHREFLAQEYEAWQEPEGLYELPVAPDQLYKENTSGGAPYGIVLPDTCADGLFTWDGGRMPFVSYLNRVFGDGGFPLHTGTDEEWEVRHRLAQDLLPLDRWVRTATPPARCPVPRAR